MATSRKPEQMEGEETLARMVLESYRLANATSCTFEPAAKRQKRHLFLDERCWSLERPVSTPSASTTESETSLSSSSSCPSASDTSSEEKASSFGGEERQLEQQEHQQRISVPGQNDVLCGRGRRLDLHPGNVAFRRMVQERKDEYCLASTQAAKTCITRQVMDHVASLEPPGRFLMRDQDNPADEGKTLVAEDGLWLGCWIEAGYEKAFAKTSQALREGAPVMKRRAKKFLAEVLGSSEVTTPLPDRQKGSGSAVASKVGSRRHSIGGQSGQSNLTELEVYRAKKAEEARMAEAQRQAEAAVDLNDMTPEQLHIQARKVIEEAQNLRNHDSAKVESNQTANMTQCHQNDCSASDNPSVIPSATLLPMKKDVPPSSVGEEALLYPPQQQSLTSPLEQLLQKKNYLDQQKRHVQQQQQFLQKQQMFTLHQQEMLKRQQRELAVTKIVAASLGLPIKQVAASSLSGAIGQAQSLLPLQAPQGHMAAAMPIALSLEPTALTPTTLRQPPSPGLSVQQQGWDPPNPETMVTTQCSTMSSPRENRGSPMGPSRASNEVSRWDEAKSSSASVSASSSDSITCPSRSLSALPPSRGGEGWPSGMGGRRNSSWGHDPHRVIPRQALLGCWDDATFRSGRRSTELSIASRHSGSKNEGWSSESSNYLGTSLTGRSQKGCPSRGISRSSDEITALLALTRSSFGSFPGSDIQGWESGSSDSRSKNS